MKMRSVVVFAFIGLAVVLGCSDSTGPEPEPIPSTIGEIRYHGETYQFDTIECRVFCTDGGDPVYSLEIEFIDTENRSIEFAIQDPGNNPANLVTPGEHRATGQHWDAVRSRMQPSTFTINYLGSDSLSVNWEEIELKGHAFSGRGFIEVHQRLELVCADSIWVGGEFAYPGDPAYEEYFERYCEPGYFYPAQKIWFECEDGIYGP
ncbi:MAG: hypothetical protein JSV33_05995 [bacterium]|nr:MAG: hypothetical protein JSV33_05995 [bacterium]